MNETTEQDMINSSTARAHRAQRRINNNTHNSAANKRRQESFHRASTHQRTEEAIPTVRAEKFGALSFSQAGSFIHVPQKFERCFSFDSLHSFVFTSVFVVLSLKALLSILIPIVPLLNTTAPTHQRMSRQKPFGQQR